LSNAENPFPIGIGKRQGNDDLHFAPPSPPILHPPGCLDAFLFELSYGRTTIGLCGTIRFFRFLRFLQILLPLRFLRPNPPPNFALEAATRTRCWIFGEAGGRRFAHLQRQLRPQVLSTPAALGHGK
jgi:hypothetical protein